MPNLDVNTVFMVTINIEAMLGLLLLFAWVQNLSIRGVGWWGCAHLMRASSVVLFGLHGSIPDAISIDIANSLLFLSYAVTWTGARMFDDREPLPIPVVFGAFLWLSAGWLPSFHGAMELRFLIASGIITAYLWLTAYEFWRSRAEALVSRWPAISLLFAQGLLFLMRTPLAAGLPWTPTDQLFESVWPTVLSFEALLLTIAIAFILLAMAKERIEQLHKVAAMMDPLTGIANRRAFFQEGAKLMSRNAVAKSALLAIDLDDFKTINDRFGHRLGDRVLQTFAQVATEVVGGCGLVARLGGEEFAVALADAERERALSTAERIRRRFADAAATVDGQAVNATLSVGVGLGGGKVKLEDLLAQADQALYRAKKHGRNRAELGVLEPTSERDNAMPPSFAEARSAA
jgi:diguanylate cyclase (GGDEF)-like protein